MPEISFQNKPTLQSTSIDSEVPNLDKIIEIGQDPSMQPVNAPSKPTTPSTPNATTRTGTERFEQPPVTTSPSVKPSTGGKKSSGIKRSGSRRKSSGGRRRSSSGGRNKPSPPPSVETPTTTKIEEITSWAEQNKYSPNPVTRSLARAVLESKKNQPPQKVTYDQLLSDIDKKIKSLQEAPKSAQIYIDNKPVSRDVAIAELRNLRSQIEIYRSQGYRLKTENGQLVFYKTKKDIEKEILNQKKQQIKEFYRKNPLAGFAHFWSTGILSWEDPLSIKSAYYAITGQSEKVFETKARASTDLDRAIKEGMHKYVIKVSTGPLATIGLSIAGGAAAGKAAGVLARTSPLAEKFFKGGMLLAAGHATYTSGEEIVREIKKGDIGKAIGKGVVTGLSFAGAGWAYKTAYTSTVEKIPGWRTETATVKTKPTVEEIVIKGNRIKTVTRGQKLVIEEFTRTPGKGRISETPSRISTNLARIFGERITKPIRNLTSRLRIQDITPKRSGARIKDITPRKSKILFIKQEVIRPEERIFPYFREKPERVYIEEYLAKVNRRTGSTPEEIVKLKPNNPLARDIIEYARMQAKFGRPKYDISLKPKNPLLARDVIEHSRLASEFPAIEKLKIIGRGSFKVGRGKNEVVIDVWKSKPSLRFDTKAELSLIRQPREVYIPEWKVTPKPELFKQINIPRFEEVPVAEKPSFKPLLIPPFPSLSFESSQILRPISLRIEIPKSFDISVPSDIVDQQQSFDTSDIVNVTNLHKTDTGTIQSITTINETITLPVYDFAEEFTLSRKRKRRASSDKQGRIFPDMPSFDLKPIDLGISKMFAKGYRYRKWKVMKIEDLLFGR